MDSKEFAMNLKDLVNKPTDEKISYSLWLRLFACLLYAASSSGLTFINKSIYVRFGFRSPLDVTIRFA
jgi:hypothetical protein